MDRKNRDFNLLDAQEEMMLVGLLKEASFGEAKMEDLRQSLCELEDFEPYSVFKGLQQGSNLSFLSAFDVASWLKRQTFKGTLLGVDDVRSVFEQCFEPSASRDSSVAAQKSGTSVRYEGFLKLVLPREDSHLRADTINRGLVSKGVPKIRSREVGSLLVQLLEAEVALKGDLLRRKKKLLEHEWLNQSKNLVKRGFVWLQSQAAVPGVGHLSVLGVSRLLGPDFKNILDTTDVERVFHRVLFQVQSDSSLLITFNEWERFFNPKEVSAHLSDLYVHHLATLCPGCGAACQREGGACQNITCSICRTTFPCKTDVVDIVDSDEENVVVEEEDERVTATRAALNSLNTPSVAHSYSNNNRSYNHSLNSSLHLADRGHSSTNNTNASLRLHSSASRPRSSAAPIIGANVTRLDYSTLERSPITMTISTASATTSSPLSPRNQGNGQKKQLVFHNRSSISSPEKKQKQFSPFNRHNPIHNLSMTSTVAPHSPAARSNQSFDHSVSSASHNNNNTSVNRSFLSLLDDDHESRQRTPSRPSSPNMSLRGPGSSLNHSVMQQARYERQKHALQLVSQTLLEMLEIDSQLEKEKTMLWQNGINVESAFGVLDRFHKNYLSDTDIWQALQMEINFQASYSQICTLFKDLKTPFHNQKDTNQLSLAEFTKLIFPIESEEWQNVTLDMKNDETRNVLYIVRATVSCPGCGIRTQRTNEGCPSITCPCCRTSYRCNLIGEDRDQTFRLTLPQKRKLRQFLCKAIQASNHTELLRKKLLHESGSSNFSGVDQDSLNSVLLDAYLLLSNDKSYISFNDMKKALLSQALDSSLNGRRFSGLSLRQIEVAWWRAAKGKTELGFVDFAQQLRTFASL